MITAATYVPLLVHHGPQMVPLELRIWPRIKPVANGCWLWTGALTDTGYAVLSRLKKHGKSVLVHRWVYEQLIGAIPDGLQIDHLCRTPPCMNPLHMEPVTMKENILRGTSPAAQRARWTHCIRGHRFTIENTRIDSDGHRLCRTCINQRARDVIAVRVAQGLTTRGTVRTGHQRHTHCKYGHLYQGDNIVLKIKNGHTFQQCRICRNAQARESKRAARCL